MDADNPLWRVFARDRTTDPVMEVEAACKEDVRRCCDHVIGPHDIDMVRPDISPPHPEPDNHRDWFNGNGR